MWKIEMITKERTQDGGALKRGVITRKTNSISFMEQEGLKCVTSG